MSSQIDKNASKQHVIKVRVTVYGEESGTPWAPKPCMWLFGAGTFCWGWGGTEVRGLVWT